VAATAALVATPLSSSPPQGGREQTERADAFTSVSEWKASVAAMAVSSLPPCGGPRRAKLALEVGERGSHGQSRCGHPPPYPPPQGGREQKNSAASRLSTIADGFCSNRRRWLWVPAFAGTTNSEISNNRPSYPAHAGYPVRRGFSIRSRMSLEYWITRWSLSSGRPKAGPVGG
jgi:hypothetical protein